MSERRQQGSDAGPYRVKPLSKKPAGDSLAVADMTGRKNYPKPLILNVKTADEFVPETAALPDATGDSDVAMLAEAAEQAPKDEPAGESEKCLPDVEGKINFREFL